ncbi:hypothetical protein TNIN_312421 [Trichonephila inaurata madagascariensis]|uniref:Uncharacterized protein n=1 Tax=Trichonephila inaurata madagascariensis TaxID=2747483 RepID=A0A8X7BPI7_9ARAC|nr:hypothetical protein TNIN_312421 [Trichonephila inaurata madagascariensis]
MSVKSDACRNPPHTCIRSVLKLVGLFFFLSERVDERRNAQARSVEENIQNAGKNRQLKREDSLYCEPLSKCFVMENHGAFSGPAISFA